MTEQSFNSTMEELSNLDDSGCLSNLGVSVQSHDSYEMDIMAKIAKKIEQKEKEQRVERSKKQITAVISELKILLKRRQAKERELNGLYASQGGTGMKRRIESLVMEQERLNSRIVELDKNQAKLVDELERCGYDIGSDPLINPVNTKLSLPEEEKEVSNNSLTEESEETEMQRDVRLGELTAFGTSLETTSQFQSEAKLDVYMKNQLGEQNLPQTSSSSSGPSEKIKKQGVKRKRQSKGKTSKKKKTKQRANDAGEGSGSDYCVEEEEDDDSGEGEDWCTDESADERTSKKFTKTRDDGDRELYIARLMKWEKSRTEEEKTLDGKYEKLKEGLKIPTLLWNKLFNYQRVAVQWMYELHKQRCGGLLGDEMGLGKTVQVIAFLASLSYTNSTDSSKATGLGPTIIVCPTTVIHQWVSELHKWWPPFRVAILHSTGSYTGSKYSLIKSINSCRGLLVMSYQAIVTHIDHLSNLNWDYIILDEGHKIRNPDAKITLAVKQIATPHRIILSGSPLQNNLKELWSLFDFIYPGKLGTLPTFIQQFSGPITQGGYANASEIQVATAFRCATVLRDTINPYLLRRMKADVKQHINLPEKNEQVLFCKLTDEQRRLYRTYIESRETKSILDGRMKVFIGLIALRKICNHPDLFYPPSREEEVVEDEEDEFGWYRRSGKMLVVHSLLKIWKKQGHRVLLFTQSRQMLKILEKYAKYQEYTYLKLDGTTSAATRQPLIDRFNGSSDIFLFLLTTRVGGLGVNLTGADRVVIFDPDWNPSTDTQARERAWRIGQDRQVTIYRLMTSGTIEEKIYHRQIYKQFLVNRVLKDPKQRRFFKSNDLYELFTLNETNDDKTETSAIFAGTGSNVKVTPPPSFKPQARKSDATRDVKTSLSRLYKEERIETAKKTIEDANKKNEEKPEALEAAKEKLADEAENQGATEIEDGEIEETAAGEDSAAKEGKESLLSDRERNELREKARRISALFSKSKSSPESKAESSRSSETPSTSGSSKKEKRKKDKGGKFEGHRVNNLVKCRQYKPPMQDEEEEQKTAESQDNYVLARLFAKSGVHSAVQHDAIVDENTHDYAIIESEANKVAKQAIRALRDSRQECMRAESGIPNWTGQNGMMRKKFSKKVKTTTLSSTDLLARMKNRNLVVSTVERPDEDEGRSLFFPSEDSGGRSARSSQQVNQPDLDLLTDIRNFIAFQARTDGEASTSELVSKFQTALPSQKSPLFKAFLKQICDFRREDGRGMWSLKAEFR